MIIVDYFVGKCVVLFLLLGVFILICLIYQLLGFENGFVDFQVEGIDEIYCMLVNDLFVMNKWVIDQDLKNVKVIFDGLGEFICCMGMLVCKDNFGFGLWLWCYVVVINNGVIEVWFEELGLCDNYGEDLYGVFLLENVLIWLKIGQVEVVV